MIEVIFYITTCIIFYFLHWYTVLLVFACIIIYLQHYWIRKLENDLQIPYEDRKIQELRERELKYIESLSDTEKALLNQERWEKERKERLDIESLLDDE